MRWLSAAERRVRKVITGLGAVTSRALEWLTTAFDDRDGLCALFAY